MRDTARKTLARDRMLRYDGSMTTRAILAAVIILAVTEIGHANAHESNAVLLAQTCLREAGWEVTDDCAAIHRVITNQVRMHGGTYARLIRAYSKPSARRPWIEQLGTRAIKPSAWPLGVLWPQHQARWVALLEHAEAVLSGEVKPACDPDHWGDRFGDRLRALSYGWRQIPCGDARNDFWVTRVHQQEIAFMR